MTIRGHPGLGILRERLGITPILNVGDLHNAARLERREDQVQHQHQGATSPPP